MELDWISLFQASENWRITVCQFQTLCKSGAIEGVIKWGAHGSFLEMHHGQLMVERGRLKFKQKQRQRNLIKL